MRGKVITGMFSWQSPKSLSIEKRLEIGEQLSDGRTNGAIDRLERGAAFRTAVGRHFLRYELNANGPSHLVTESWPVLGLAFVFDPDVGGAGGSRADRVVVCVVLNVLRQVVLLDRVAAAVHPDSVDAVSFGSVLGDQDVVASQ